MRLPFSAPAPAVVPPPTASACRVLTGHGSGSGFVVGADGLIATCAHGVYADAPVRVEFADRTVYDGIVVAFRPERDLALIQIEGVFGLPAVRLGDPRALPLGTRLHVVGFDQLPESTYAAVYLPGSSRYGMILGPTALEVGLAGMLEVLPDGEDGGFDCALTTRTNQVRPGSSGAMVCAADGSVVGIHTAAMELGGFGQEISAVELTALLAAHPKPAATKPQAKTFEGARRRWERVWYAFQCLEMDRGSNGREEEDFRGDLRTLASEPGGPPDRDPEVFLARAIAHRGLGEWSDAVAEARRTVELGDSRGLMTLRQAIAEPGAGIDPNPILRFLEERIAAMPEVERRFRIREAHLAILLDLGLNEEAAAWGDAGEEDARIARDAARFLMDRAKALHALGRQEDADTWTRRAVWEPGGSDLTESEIALVSVDGADPFSRWYGFRKSLGAMLSGEGGTRTLAPLASLLERQGAGEAAAVFAALARAFDGTLVPADPEPPEGAELPEDGDDCPPVSDGEPAPVEAGTNGTPDGI